MNLRPLGYEPNELPGCSTPRQEMNIISRKETFVNLLRALGGKADDPLVFLDHAQLLPCLALEQEGVLL